MTSGHFIVLEGLDGSGKTSIARRLSQFLVEKNIDAILTKEPTENFHRDAELEGKRDYISSMRLFFEFTADRITHSEVIGKWVSEGKTVVCDRFLYSSLAYQGTIICTKFESNEDGIGWMREVSRVIHLKPEMCIYLDIDPETAMSRISGRMDSASGFEELEFLRAVRNTYLTLPECREGMIDASKSLEDTLESVKSMINSRLRLW